MTTLRTALSLFLLTGSILNAQLPFEVPVGQVVADSGSATTLYAGTRAGVLKSTDSGATWIQAPVNPLGLPQPPVTALAADPGRPGVLYMGTNAENQYLWRSPDGGATWQSISAGLGEPAGYTCGRILLRPAFAALYVELQRTAGGGAPYQLWKSTDDGATWQRLTNESRRTDVSSSTPMVMYRPGGGFEIERSNDEGKTWKTAGVVRPSSPGDLDGINDVAVSPVDHDVLISTATGPTASLNGIFRSTDGGSSWNRVVATNSIEVEFDPANKNQVFAGDCCGKLSIYRSQDGGVNWQQVDINKLTGTSGAASLTFVIKGSTYFVPTSKGVFSGQRTDPAWTLLGTYRPTLAAMPPALQTALLAHGSSRVRTSLNVAPLEGGTVGALDLTVATDPADWLTVTGTNSLFARLDASSLAPGVYNASIHVSSANAVNQLEIPVTLTVTDQVRRPFVILDEPLPSAGLARSVTLNPQGAPVYATSTQILRLASDGTATVVAGNGDRGTGGDGGPAVDAELQFIEELHYDASGNLYFVDDLKHLIRKVDTRGIISTVAGTESGFTQPTNGAVATAVRLTTLGGITVNDAGVLHFAASDRIWQLASDGTIKLVAGGGNVTTDNVRSVVASLRLVDKLAFNAVGEIVFSEHDMHRIRLIDKAGMVRTLAGSGQEGYDGDGGSAVNARLSRPGSITFDAVGQVYFTGQGGLVIRRVRNDGTIQTVMGNGTAGDTGYCTAAETAPANGLTSPVFTPDGRLLVVDGSDSYRLWIGDQAGGEPPSVGPGAVVNAASFVPQLAEGGLFSIFGERVAARREQASGLWPYVLGDAVVCLDDRPQPLYFTDTGQINGQTSYGVATGTHWMRVYSLTGGSSAIEVQVTAAAPGIFQYGDSHAVATNPDGSVNGPANPVDGGAYIVAYLTGIGAVDNPVPTGGLALGDPLSRPTGEVTVTINGQETTVIFLGLTPGFIGLAQANINIPDLAPGDYDLVITIGGVSSAPVRISVR